MMNRDAGIVWPEGRRFAFTIIDDTDLSTVENVKPVYDFLHELGFRTTKTVWPLSPKGEPIGGGHSLEEPGYRDFILELRERGFEIALHGAADESSSRPRVLEALDRFERIVGGPPRIHANHTGQAESLYWGEDRFDGAMRHLYRLARRHVARADSKFYGQEEASVYFWGDLCRERVTFVRNFIFNDINTLRADPLMPYHDPRRPYVPYWFSASAAFNLEDFCKLLHEDNQDRLAAEGGACIAYTHFAFRFFENGRLDPRFVALMRRLASLPGWFAPVSPLLDVIGEHRGWRDAGRNRRALSRMQWRWMLQKIRRGDEGAAIRVKPAEI